jgi:hypothetical protein
MARQMSALLDQRASQGSVGRSRELTLLGRMTSREDETLLAHLHGIAGVGKTAVLEAFLADERGRRTAVRRGGRDRPVGLPEPDQQRARVPRGVSGGCSTRTRATSPTRCCSPPRRRSPTWWPSPTDRSSCRACSTRLWRLRWRRRSGAPPERPALDFSRADAALATGRRAARAAPPWAGRAAAGWRPAQPRKRGMSGVGTRW